MSPNLPWQRSTMFMNDKFSSLSRRNFLRASSASVDSSETDLDGSWVPYKAVGCERCKGSGYKGRVGIYQVMPITETMQDMILKHATALDIGREAQRIGVRDLRQSGLLKVKQGMTSLEEVLGCTNE